MQKDVFDKKATEEFGKFLNCEINMGDVDIYSELVKQLFLKSCCAN